ncbi:glycoside hydrolase family protein [Pseudoalteromonas piscicida]|uniref:glycoside hydrolase family protein n=1 Tax=Pseudoalteromonas piscicida TaxID=43662 RepID=UPI0030A706EA
MFNNREKFYQRVIAHLLQFEGEVLHLYLDINGNPTIGVGFHMQSVDQFCRLPMRDRRAKRTATLQQKRDEYRTLKYKPSGYKASWYAQYTELTLPPKASKRLLIEQIKSFEQSLNHFFAKQDVGCIPYQQLPTPAKIALLDMAYNLGTSKLFLAFPNLIKAVSAQNWQQASQECSRLHISPARNDATKQLFLKCTRYNRYQLSWFQALLAKLKRWLD